MGYGNSLWPGNATPKVIDGSSKLRHRTLRKSSAMEDIVPYGSHALWSPSNPRVNDPDTRVTHMPGSGESSAELDIGPYHLIQLIGCSQL